MAHLVFQTAFPGDLFLSIPLLKNLRTWEPQTPVVLACRPGLGDYFLKAKLVDAVIEVDKRTASSRAKALAQLSKEQWELIFVPHESVRTALWTWRLKATRGKVGFRKWWNGLVFTHRVKKPMNLPDALRQLSLMAPFEQNIATELSSMEVSQLENPTSQDSPLSLKLPQIPDWASMQVPSQATSSATSPASLTSASQISSASASPISAPHGRRIFLAPGSVWATKRWTEEGFAEVARQLCARGDEVVLIGSPAELSVCQRIKQAVPQVSNLAGKTSLVEMVELLDSATALICNDSGAMHAAATLALPTVSIFGPTTLQLGFRPWNNNAVVVQKALSCRPCGKHGAVTCPIKTHACMKSISPAEVVTALDNLL